MAFHVACPITCKRICFCPLGFPVPLQTERKRNEFLEEVLRLENFLNDQCFARVGGKGTIKIPVPRIVPTATALVDGGDGIGPEGDDILSAQTKRAELQRRAAAASLAAEDYARRFESGTMADASGEIAREAAGDEPCSSAAKIMCRICFSGESEGSSRALRMLPCGSCSKKYHRNCLKSWAEHRDLFHWNSWVCPSCRVCEVCRRAGDPSKFMFCKRCDRAYHCYCQQPPHKNPSPGAFLCPRHTRCHSCGSTVPGNGLSTRWFLEYTCCDACGRLFVKGKYCPVCLKVYRDSESTPMVCCDACQRWVHCVCDGISDEKYQQFQADGNLYYKCAACRGDCYQVRDLNDAVQELWRRRDRSEQDEIANLRAVAGLPSQEDEYSSTPYSDEDENGAIIMKSDHGQSLKLSVKDLGDKVLKNAKENSRKSSKKFAKKEDHLTIIGQAELERNLNRLKETQSPQSSVADESAEGLDLTSSRIPVKGKSYASHSGSNNHTVDPFGVGKEDRADKIVQVKSAEKKSSKSDAVKGTKLVIHLGARKKNVNSSISEPSSHKKEQDFTASNGRRLDSVRSSKHGGKESGLIKVTTLKFELTDVNPNNGGGAVMEGIKCTYGDKKSLMRGNVPDVKCDQLDVNPTIYTVGMSGPTISNDGVASGASVALSGNHADDSLSYPASSSSPKDAKPLLKLKFKNPYVESRHLWGSQGKDEKSWVKGQRSKRKRPSELMERSSVQDRNLEARLRWDGSSSIDEVMDANWILKRLGKDAIGKRVEVHHPSDNSWHKGVIVNVVEGTSVLAVCLEDGRTRTLELGKQGIRFISQKQKRTKMISM